MLNEQAKKMINDYFNLPFSNAGSVRCPYLVNSKANQRGQLRVLVGKGTPQEIVDEAKITSIQYGHDIFNKQGDCKMCAQNVSDTMRHYLIDNGLGIDCSGFVTHVLRQYYLQLKGVDFTKKLFIVPPGNILRWLISRLRPVENIGVKHYADDKNTVKITNLKQIQPADLIIMLKTGPSGKRDHIILIEDITNDVLHYVHARAWSSEGKYGHGVSRGQIKINNFISNLLDQNWQENGKTNQENETYMEAKNAKVLEIRRIII